VPDEPARLPFGFGVPSRLVVAAVLHRRCMWPRRSRPKLARPLGATALRALTDDRSLIAIGHLAYLRGSDTSHDHSSALS
jgi:hypothetical protein